MNCPYCNKKVSLLSKEMNAWGKSKKCPHCGGEVNVKLNIKTFVKYMLVIMTIAVIINLSFFQDSIYQHFVIGVGSGLGVMLSLELREYKKECKEESKE